MLSAYCRLTDRWSTLLRKVSLSYEESGSAIVREGERRFREEMAALEAKRKKRKKDGSKPR